MKKSIKLLLIILFSILLIGCKKNDGYQLIELTGSDLLEAINNNEKIMYATINLSEKKGEEFKRDLERIAKEHHTDIYYVDSSRMNFWEDETIYIINSIDTRKNYLYVIEAEAKIEYTNYKELEASTSEYKSEKIKKITSDKEKQEHLQKAKDLYKEGKINDSYNELTTCWTLKEAKEFYKNNKYFKLFNEWEYRAQNNNDLKIKKITIFDVSDLLFTYEYNGKVADYKEPKANAYNDYSYIVKDDIIYIEEKDEYVPKYKIISLTDEEIILEENNVQTVYMANKKES